MADSYFLNDNYGDVPEFSSSYLRKYIADNMESKLNLKNQKKFILISSHDSVVAMILSAMDLR